MAEEKNNSSPTEINSSLGSFNKSTSPFAQPVAKTTDDSKQPVEKEGKEDIKINFEKFEKARKSRNKSAFEIKYEGWLRNKKSLVIIWLVIFGVFAIILGSMIPLIIFNTKDVLGSSTSLFSTNYWGDIKSISTAGNVLSYVACGILGIPIIYMIIAFVVGINGVLYSNGFHLAIWICLLVALACVIVAAGCSGFALSEVVNFHSPKTS